MVCMTIFDRNINDNLSSKIISVMAYIKNIKLISSLKNKNLYNIHVNKTSKLSHLHILRFTIYIFSSIKKIKHEIREIWDLNIKRNSC